ncbi:HTH DNA binding protein [Gordonia phage Frokostdame]|uniref:Helix-turn-helix DNA binding protein n=1 Tax=Gordonia phage Frokostdame TaxID=2250320 RepID=A0A345L335_9CAUD|nr:HTH DNA binding protein [Gordonia phage Frokostdame]AXH49687.1 helix-turn-helix DNA binding protein [Gordonia phage Frokostdame]
MRTPPHVSVKTLRTALKLTLDDVADRIEENTGDRPTRGALSAVESGLRGASVELLAAMEMAFEIEPGSITTTYQPRSTPHASGEEVPA